MKRLGCGFAGAISGLFAGPIGGVAWLLALQATSGGGEDLDTTAAEWFQVGLTFAYFATIIAGIPGALLGLAIGKAFGHRPLGVRRATVAVAIGTITGMLLLGSIDRGRETTWLLMAALSGAFAGLISFAIFLLLRRPIPDN